MAGESLSNQAEFAIVGQGKPEGVVTLLEEGLQSADMYTTTGDFMPVRAASEEVANALVYARGSIDQLDAVLKGAHALLEVVLDAEQLAAYDTQVNDWRARRAEWITAVLKGNSGTDRLAEAVLEAREPR